jgi:hypothetical protein
MIYTEQIVETVTMNKIAKNLIKQNDDFFAVVSGGLS